MKDLPTAVAWGIFVSAVGVLFAMQSAFATYHGWSYPDSGRYTEMAQFVSADILSGRLPSLHQLVLLAASENIGYGLLLGLASTIVPVTIAALTINVGLTAGIIAIAAGAMERHVAWWGRHESAVFGACLLLLPSWWHWCSFALKGVTVAFLLLLVFRALLRFGSREGLVLLLSAVVLLALTRSYLIAPVLAVSFVAVALRKPSWRRLAFVAAVGLSLIAAAVLLSRTAAVGSMQAAITKVRNVEQASETYVKNAHYTVGQFAAQNPVDYAARVVMASFTPNPLELIAAHRNQAWYVMDAPWHIESLLILLLLPWIARGAVRLWRDSAGRIIPMMVLAILAVQAYFPSFVDARHRAPIMPLIVLLFVAGMRRKRSLQGGLAQH